MNERGNDGHIRSQLLIRDSRPKKQAKADRRKCGWTKPKIPTMQKAYPKPKVADFIEENDEDGEIEGEQEEEEASSSQGDGSDGGDSD